MLTALAHRPMAQPPVVVNKAYSVYLVRHAEKNPGADSTLTPAGELRAEKLKDLLRNKGITRVYVTKFRRSYQTGKPTATALGIDTVLYRADTTGEGLVEAMNRRGDWGNNILVVGHSNTVLKLVKKLGGEPGIPEIGETEFGHLFELRIRKKKVRTDRRMY